jgi:hypothetical protein
MHITNGDEAAPPHVEDGSSRCIKIIPGMCSYLSLTMPFVHTKRNTFFSQLYNLNLLWLDDSVASTSKIARGTWCWVELSWYDNTSKRRSPFEKKNERNNLLNEMLKSGPQHQEICITIPRSNLTCSCFWKLSWFSEAQKTPKNVAAAKAKNKIPPI